MYKLKKMILYSTNDIVTCRDPPGLAVFITIHQTDVFVLFAIKFG